MVTQMSSPTRLLHAARLPVLLALLLALPGCSSLQLKKPEGKGWSFPWSKKSKVKESEYQQPMRMAVVWTPETLAPPGRTPTRGFAGRLYFYNNQQQTIPVEGQLVVFAYDDTDKEGRPQSREPDRKFAFTPEQFTEHFSESDLGASYSVWLPWDATGGPFRSISLLPVFTSVSGQQVVGAQSTSTLQGRREHPVGADQPNIEELPPQVTPVQYIQGARDASAVRQAAADQQRRLHSSTIELSRSLERRLTQVGPGADIGITSSNSAAPASTATPPTPPASIPAPAMHVGAGNVPGYSIPGYNVPGNSIPGHGAPGYVQPGPTAAGIPGYGGVPGYGPTPGYGQTSYGQAPAYGLPPGTTLPPGASLMDQYRTSGQMQDAAQATATQLQQSAQGARRWPERTLQQARFVPSLSQAPATPGVPGGPSLAGSALGPAGAR